MNDLLRSAYPEVDAGGFTRFDGSVQFYGRVRSLVTPDSHVLDFGAGRGKWASDPVGYRRGLRHLKGSVANVVGIDVDRAVLTNPTLDRALVMPSEGRIPIPDQSIDVVIADYVLEHVTDPVDIANEIDRVLRPGGWFCARTPNRNGMTAVVARMVPNSFHVGALRKFQPEKEARDTFPTAYRMNKSKTLKRLFPQPGYSHHSYTYDSEPGYAGRSQTLFWSMIAAKRLSPARFRETLMVFVHKSPRLDHGT